MQTAWYIYNFSKKVLISFERGDFDVRTSHAKPHLFFALFRMYHVLDTLFFTQKHRFSPDHKLGALQNTLRNALYIVHFWKKVVISFERGDIDVRPSHTKSLLF